MSLEVVLATSNEGKVREAHRILGPRGVEIVTLPLWLGDVETGVTYAENARLKAAAAIRMLQRPVLAEDSGLEVDALHGLPGPRSARFGGASASDEQNNAKLLALLSDVADGARTARYRAVAVLLYPSGASLVGEGTFEGSIAREPRGEGGFGYDPLFLPAAARAAGRTAAELEPEVKNAISHRARALEALAAQL